MLPKFRTRRLRRAQNHIETAFSLHKNDVRSYQPQNQPFPEPCRAKSSQILGSSGLCQAEAQAALLFNQNPNVKLIVVQSSYCYSVVRVNTSNTVQPLTFGCSSWGVRDFQSAPSRNFVHKFHISFASLSGLPPEISRNFIWLTSLAPHPSPCRTVICDRECQAL